MKNLFMQIKIEPIQKYSIQYKIKLFHVITVTDTKHKTKIIIYSSKSSTTTISLALARSPFLF